MNLKRILVLLVMFAAACATPGPAQVFWSKQSPGGITDDVWCVAYASGTFAAVTGQGNLLTSPDGLNWNSQSIDKGVCLLSITYGNGIWVVVGDSGAILVSSDLNTWITVAPVTGNRLNSVLYNGNVFIAVGANATIVKSPDARAWKGQPVPSGVTASLNGIGYSPSLNVTPYSILVAGDNGTLLAGFYDGTGFISLDSGTSQNLEAAFVQLDPSFPYITVVVGGNGTLINDGYGAEWVPGGAWQGASSVNTSATLRGLAFGAGCFVAAGEQGTILTSKDGKAWAQRFSGDSPSTLSSASLLSAAYSPTLQRFVVTGTGGTILVSNAAPTVLGNVSTRGYVSSTQTFIGGFVIEGTGPRTVLIRAGGPVLGTFSVPSPLPDPVLTVYNSAGTVIATNAGWTANANPGMISTAAQAVGAFALPNPSPDSALLLTLQPGPYTAQITSAKGNSGAVLFEAYTD
ncbi:MAG TPA: hypothetical protein VN829_20270 [Dongiaceae bacterium]|nr:hypothetical protein [Dongiaceae bacterium]